MKIAIIAAMAKNRVIGINNQLPWKLPADMRWFRQHTLGKPIVMGRKTFESFGGKPLPERHNIVITRDQGYSTDGATVAHSVDEAIVAAGNVDELMIIGGASFYEQMLPVADRMYLTLVDMEPDGDAWFPEYNEMDWQQVERQDHQADDKNPCAYSFLILERV